MLTLRLRKIIEILNTIIIFFGLNLVWVNFVVNKYLKNVIKNIQKFPLQRNNLSWVISNFAMLTSLYGFVLQWKNSEMKREIKLFSALCLALVIFSVYSLNNKSLFTNWPWKLVILDIIGGVLVFLGTTFFTIVLEKPTNPEQSSGFWNHLINRGIITPEKQN